MKPVLLAYSGPGQGHRMAAMALREAFLRERTPIVCLDTLTTALPLFRFLYAGLYRVMARHAHTACEQVYRITDRTRQGSPMIRAIDWWSRQNTTAFQALARNLAPETAVCTHFLPMALLSLMRERGEFSGQIHVAITDYDLHGFWVDPGVDRYYAASVQVRDRLAAKGIPDSRIAITGIPVRESFARLALAPRRKGNPLPLQVLFLAHSISGETSLEIIDRLEDLGMPVRLTVVGDRNLLENRQNGDTAWHDRVTDLSSLMAASDLLVTKPGGLVCSEALAAGLPMLFTSPIPMQETLNALYLQGQGAGILCGSPGEIAGHVRQFLREPEILRRMGHACQRMSSPGAAAEIARRVLGLKARHREWEAAVTGRRVPLPTGRA